jgi:hypothetical protein
MKQELINIKYKDCINITVPATFSFRYVVQTIGEVENMKIMYETEGDVTAYCILKHVYPDGARFMLKNEPKFVLIPLEDLECKSLGEIEI